MERSDINYRVVIGSEAGLRAELPRIKADDAGNSKISGGLERSDKD